MYFDNPRVDTLLMTINITNIITPLPQSKVSVVVQARITKNINHTSCNISDVFILE